MILQILSEELWSVVSSMQVEDWPWTRSSSDRRGSWLELWKNTESIIPHYHPFRLWHLLAATFLRDQDYLNGLRSWTLPAMWPTTSMLKISQVALLTNSSTYCVQRTFYNGQECLHALSPQWLPCWHYCKHWPPDNYGSVWWEGITTYKTCARDSVNSPFFQLWKSITFFRASAKELPSPTRNKKPQ